MDDDRTFTAFCGLHCRDCIPSDRRLLELAHREGPDAWSARRRGHYPWQ